MLKFVPRGVGPMTTMDEDDLRRLFGEGRGAHYELDLTGVTLDHARQAIERMLERQRFRDDERSVVVRLDRASETSGETLFQPVGRLLLAAMKKGRIGRCRPLPLEQGAGYYIELPGRE